MIYGILIVVCIVFGLLGILILRFWFDRRDFRIKNTSEVYQNLYADLKGMPEFDVLDLDAPYTPEKYIEAIHAAENEGYDILIVDSMTHEWDGQGGCLELIDQIARAKYRGNTWSAWSELTPRHRRFVDAMLQSKCHIIATMRSKTETVQTENDKGKKVIQKLGMKAIQRDGMDYEFTVVFDLQADGHFATVSKDRTALFNDPIVLSESVGAKIADWLKSAHKEEVKPKKEAEEVSAPEEKKPEISFELSIRVDEFLDAIEDCPSIEDLKNLGAQIPKLGLPEGCKELDDLRKAYKEKLDELKQ